jgi:type I restriction enzyme S subunit
LRFPEFKEEWVTKKFANVGEFFKGTGISKDKLTENGNPCILYGELYTKYKNEVIKEVFSKTDINTKGLVSSKANDIIIPSSGESAVDIATACCVNLNDVLLGGDLNVIRPYKDNGNFISYQLNGKRKFEIAKIAQGSSVTHLYNESLKKLHIKISDDITEQNKIATLLSLIDDRIQTQSKIIQRLESLIKATIQILINGNRPNWEKQYLYEILTEREEKNIDNNIIHSVSVSKGVINQIEYLGRSFAAKDTSHYNVVYYGDIIYTKSPTGSFPYGIIKQSYIQNKIAVSPLYGVFIPNNIHLATILHHYFNNPINTSNYLHSLIQKGAKNTINIINQNFLNKQIFLPTDEREMKLIANLLQNLTDKINLEKNLMSKLNNQKKYLLQNLFI